MKVCIHEKLVVNMVMKIRIYDIEYRTIMLELEIHSTVATFSLCGVLIYLIHVKTREWNNYQLPFE